MQFRNILILIIIFFLTGCEQDNLKLKTEKKYKNIGFTLIYNENLDNENLDIKNFDQRSLQIFHKNLKKKSFVKITNPVNDKSLIAEVKSNKIIFSKFYNSIITNRIAETLDLNLNEPYIEIVLISKNSTFVAKKANTFEEEKEVAEKAPIDGIKISSLGSENENKTIQPPNKKFSYSIKVADFYFKKSAELMMERIISKILLKNIKVIKLSKTNYRVLLGPFNDINSLMDSFEKIDSLNFENLEILKNV